MRKIRHREVCGLSKATQLVSSGAGIHPCPLMQDPVFLTFNCIPFLCSLFFYSTLQGRPVSLEMEGLRVRQRQQKAHRKKCNSWGGDRGKDFWWYDMQGWESHTLYPRTEPNRRPSPCVQSQETWVQVPACHLCQCVLQPLPNLWVSLSAKW